VRNSEKYKRLGSTTNDFLNSRSAHNSYANHLSETGIVGFTFLVLLLLPFVFWFLTTFWSGTDYKGGLMIFILTGFFGALVHGYAITAFTGANFWFMLGFCRAFIRMNR
jgi:hypothetical protein